MVDDMRGNGAEEDVVSSGMARLPPIIWCVCVSSSSSSLPCATRRDMRGL